MCDVYHINASGSLLPRIVQARVQHCDPSLDWTSELNLLSFEPQWSPHLCPRDLCVRCALVGQAGAKRLPYQPSIAQEGPALCFPGKALRPAALGHLDPGRLGSEHPGSTEWVSILSATTHPLWPAVILSDRRFHRCPRLPSPHLPSVSSSPLCSQDCGGVR